MATGHTILQRYANALHALAREAGTLEPVEAQLADLDVMLAENADLRAELANPCITREVKTHVLVDLLGEAVDPLVRGTVLLLARKGRAGLLPELAEVFRQVSMRAAGKAVARVETAVALDDEQRGRIQAALATLTAQDVTVEETVEEALLGGLRVTIGSRMIDGSLRRRLEKLQDQMLRAPLAQG